jgi:2-amino-4-hydroxy-6-hydroxymethyldihydropteridine diphosphokinase
MFVYLGLGSNLGDRVAHLRTGISALAASGTMLAVSPVYASVPMYITDQPEFLNMAALLETQMSVQALLAVCKRIEAEAGRDLSPMSQRNGPRPLDIDLLLALAERKPNDPQVALRLATPALTLPHPRLRERAFVLVPLCALEPTLIDPRTFEAICELADAVRDQPLQKLGDLADL